MEFEKIKLSSLHIFAYIFQVDAKKHTLAKYLMEMTLVDYELSLLLPSQIAAAASYLSTHLIDKQSAEWVRV